MPNSVPNETLRKFGYPQNLLHEGRHWAVLVRPSQPTLGSLVLCALSDATRYGDLSPEAFAEQGRLIAIIERALTEFIQYERLNYLMLMMVDPYVHFHVLPRYEGEQHFFDQSFPDRGWPGVPDLTATNTASDELVHALRQAWQRATHEKGES